jgi:hypothetical protein
VGGGARGITLAGDGAGDVTALWGSGSITAGAEYTAWRGPGEPFTPPVRIPWDTSDDGDTFPDAVPVRGGDAFYFWFDGPDSQEINHRHDVGLMVVRRHDGAFGTPREVARGVALDNATGAVDDQGTLTLAWTHHESRASELYASTGTPESGFTPPRMISDPAAYPSNLNPDKALSIARNERGDIALAWTIAAGPSDYQPRNIGLDFAIKPAGADWQATERIPGVPGEEQDLALDDKGNAIVAWSNLARGVQVAYRHSGGRWAATTGVVRRPVCCAVKPPTCCDERNPKVALDGHCNAIVLWDEGPGRQVLRAAVRSADGLIHPYEEITAHSGLVRRTDLAVGHDGRAIAVWGATESSDPHEPGVSQIRAATFDPSAPAITGFAAGPSAKPVAPSRVIAPQFAYRLTEPARVRVTIETLDRHRRSTGRVASLRARRLARSGRLMLPAHAARRLSRKGRYRATISAVGADRRAAAPRSIEFRRVRVRR